MTAHDDRDRRLWHRYLAARPAGAGDCPPADLLAAFLDGRLTSPEREAVEAHLADCAACREAVGEARAILDEPRALPGPAVLEAARALVADDAKARPAVTVSRRLADWRAVGGWSMAAAASIAVCVIAYRLGGTSVAAPASEVELIGELSFGLLNGHEQRDLLDVAEDLS